MYYVTVYMSTQIHLLSHNIFAHENDYLPYIEVFCIKFQTNGTTRTEYTYAKVIDMCRKLHIGLLSLGVKKGDIISIYAYNSAEFIAMVIASLMAGMTVNTCNPAATTCMISTV